ncbi:MAG: hypothetical protein HY606_02575, partial [Planctomycetes bacterium]|nr:hypothetical protein [Planctomycetota bacterium]
MRGRRLFIIALLITVFVGWFAVWGVAEITNWEWNLDAKDKKVEAPIGTIVKVKITSNSTVPTRLLSRPFKEMGEVDTELTDRLDENPVVNGGSDISFRTGGLTAGEYYIIVQERQASDNNLVGQASTSRFTLVEPFIQPVKAPPSIPQTGIPVSSESDNATASTDTPSETRLTRYGFYVSPHANNETMPPYAYYPDPGVFANYDFSVFQAFRTRIYETANLIKAIKKAKPSFKTIVIKQQDMGWTLDYYYNADSRQVELEEFKTLIEQCGVNNVDGVTFHEEEPMNIYGGWFDDKKIPAWAEKYKDIYIEESSDSSWTWETHQANAQYYNWIIQKTIWSYNHLYDS